MSKVHVWDWPTRAFHWLLALGVVAGYVTGTWFGGMENHMLIGQAVFGLVVFRIVWGIVGGRHARFASFIAGPKAALGYGRRLLTGQGWRPHAGHSPIGGWATLALIAVVLAQSASGLMTSDDILWDGPLYGVVPAAMSDLAMDVHEIAINILIALVVLHLLAIGFYARVRKTDLVKPMVTGETDALPADEARADSKGGLFAFVIAAACGVGAVAAVNLVG